MTSRAARRMARDARRLSVEASRFADLIEAGGPYAGDAHRLLVQASRILLCAARLDGREEKENE